jgi:mercuric ion transport protein
VIDWGGIIFFMDNKVIKSDKATKKIIATGGLLGAIAASTCCVLPVILFALGISGAWISNLVSLARYKPFFIVLSLVFIGTGLWMVYFKPQISIPKIQSTSCYRPFSEKTIKIMLWSAVIIILIVFLIPYIAPSLLGV